MCKNKFMYMFVLLAVITVILGGCIEAQVSGARLTLVLPQVLIESEVGIIQLTFKDGNYDYIDILYCGNSQDASHIVDNKCHLISQVDKSVKVYRRRVGDEGYVHSFMVRAVIVRNNRVDFKYSPLYSIRAVNSKNSINIDIEYYQVVHRIISDDNNKSLTDRIIATQNGIITPKAPPTLYLYTHVNDSRQWTRCTKSTHNYLAAINVSAMPSIDRSSWFDATYRYTSSFDDGLDTSVSCQIGEGLARASNIHCAITRNPQSVLTVDRSKVPEELNYYNGTNQKKVFDAHSGILVGAQYSSVTVNTISNSESINTYTYDSGVRSASFDSFSGLSSNWNNRVIRHSTIPVEVITRRSTREAQDVIHSPVPAPLGVKEYSQSPLFTEALLPFDGLVHRTIPQNVFRAECSYDYTYYPDRNDGEVFVSQNKTEYVGVEYPPRTSVNSRYLPAITSHYREKIIRFHLPYRITIRKNKNLQWDTTTLTNLSFPINERGSNAIYNYILTNDNTIVYTLDNLLAIMNIITKPVEGTLFVESNPLKVESPAGAVLYYQLIFR